ncbi:hypothetical protein TIFTF001_024151 [Ficus carica]|uniref:Ubiquitin-like protease family profile domain-containing protein n=1 Tax=Ficus carica TaxID=3494 RepID=A0AA88AMV6_FICCA|nr:hypothetical protein TIFTF001_024151 [Ficus carica]
MRREIKELKALVRGLCANKDMEPSFTQENVPTVDQHNSFKASCYVQEKQHGVSDPPTMPVDSQECKLYIFDEIRWTVACCVWKSMAGEPSLRYSPWDSTGYLEELCRINGQAEKFVFLSPTLVSPVRTDTEDAGMRERADVLIGFLRDAPKGRLNLVPHNRGRHWVLGVIDPWEDLVLYFDPLREKKRDDFTNLMRMALTDWKLMTGEGIRRRRDCKMKISDRHCPIQERSVKCGYFILGRMG